MYISAKTHQTEWKVIMDGIQYSKEVYFSSAVVRELVTKQMLPLILAHVSWFLGYQAYNSSHHLHYIYPQSAIMAVI